MFHGLGEFIGKPFVGGDAHIAPPHIEDAIVNQRADRVVRPYNELSTVRCVTARRHVVMPPYEGLSVAGM